jgi:uncharacterized damage-inducible protein DinB
MALIKDVLLSEFDNEMALTRRLLARLPEPAFGWKPHEKSMTLGGLATHVAQIPHWGTSILQRDSYDLILDHTASAADKQTVADVLAAFDAHTAEVRTTLVEQTDAQLAAPWAFRRGGQLIMTLPRLGALRRFFLNHLVHHRGQLTVYLRLLNVPLPPMYGPTADETM